MWGGIGVWLMVEHWPSICDALGSILSIGKKRKIPRSPPHHHHLLLEDRILTGAGSPPTLGCSVGSEQSHFPSTRDSGLPFSG